MSKINENINRMKFLIGFRTSEILSEQAKTEEIIVEQTTIETQDITGPFALAGAIQDCYVYEYDTTTQNIQKYKSTGEKDHLYNYAGENNWGGSDTQDAKFRKAIDKFMNSGFKGGAFKAKPWQGAEQAAKDIGVAMESIGKEYCGIGAERVKPVPTIDEAWLGTWQVEGVTVDSPSYVDGSPMIMSLKSQNESGDIIGSGCNCEGEKLDCNSNENGVRYLNTDGEEIDELYIMSQNTAPSNREYILDAKKFVALFGSKPNEGKYKVKQPDSCKEPDEPMAYVEPNYAKGDTTIPQDVSRAVGSELSSRTGDGTF